MRIIVGSDYYDSGMAFGHDDHITFVREKDKKVLMNECLIGQDLIHFYVQPVKKNPSRRYISANQFYVKDTLYNIQPISVIFCGKRYNGVKVSACGDDKATYFWDFDKFHSFLNDHEHYLNVTRDTTYLDRWSGRTHYRNAEYFNTRPLTTAEMDYVMNNGITIMVNDGTYIKDYNGSFWHINSFNLKDVQFYKAVDAYTAFQEIEMWIGGVLPRPGNPMVVITDDKVKAAKHGFDQWSFRKMKEST